MISDRVLRVVMYRYVRDPARNAFPKLNALQLEDFRHQVKELSTQYEIASIESSLDFLAGEYRPRRDLCLLTFDDGLKEHFTEVLPVLVEKRIRAVFFVITSCLEEKQVAAGSHEPPPDDLDGVRRICRVILPQSRRDVPRCIRPAERGSRGRGPELSVGYARSRASSSTFSTSGWTTISRSGGQGAVLRAYFRRTELPPSRCTWTGRKSSRCRDPG